ncbi:MAG: hypothetical protein U0525_05460 [Patescibacteria group bacterium]
MTTLLEFVEEYWLILQTHAISPFKKIPARWKNGIKGDVILIPGFGETWCFLEIIGNTLNTEGYRIHTIQMLSYNTRSTKDSASVLNKYFYTNDLQDVIFISHSKGGIIAKYFIDNSEHSKKVKWSISIATPYKGSRFGYLQLLNLKEIAPDSALLKKLLANKSNISKIINIHAKWDDHIGDVENAKLPEAQNIEVELYGHARVLQSKDTLDQILKVLS